MAFKGNFITFTLFWPIIPTAEVQKRHIPNKTKKSIEMELLINSNSNSNSWETLLTIAIAIVPKMSIAIEISILLISSAIDRMHNVPFTKNNAII